VQEASANAVEHAYAPGSAAFGVDARHDDGVTRHPHHGQWREARGGRSAGAENPAEPDGTVEVAGERGRPSCCAAPEAAGREPLARCTRSGATRRRSGAQGEIDASNAEVATRLRGLLATAPSAWSWT
jgi:hypothetical protein